MWSGTDQGTDGWFRPSLDVTARGWAYNVFNVNTTTAASYNFEFEGDETGSQGAKAFFVGRVVVMSSYGEAAYSEIAMSSPTTGSASVQITSETSSLFFVIASVPEFFGSYQTYGYKAKITMN